LNINILNYSAYLTLVVLTYYNLLVRQRVRKKKIKNPNTILKIRHNSFIKIEHYIIKRDNNSIEDEKKKKHMTELIKNITNSNCSVISTIFFN